MGCGIKNGTLIGTTFVIVAPIVNTTFEEMIKGDTTKPPDGALVYILHDTVAVIVTGPAI